MPRYQSHVFAMERIEFLCQVKRVDRVLDEMGVKIDEVIIAGPDKVQSFVWNAANHADTGFQFHQIENTLKALLVDCLLGQPC